MIRHVVLINVKADAPEGAAERMVEGVRKLPAEIPLIRSWEVGLGRNPGGATVGIVALFDDLASYAKYHGDPAHQRCAEAYIVPVMESATQIQFEVAGPVAMENPA
jgi:Stress responsive A/B Barrel Domain